MYNLSEVEDMSRASLDPIVEKCSLKGVGNLVKVTGRYDT